MTQYSAEDLRNIDYANAELLVGTESPPETGLIYQWDSAEFPWKHVFRKCLSYQIDSFEGTCNYDWRMLIWHTPDSKVHGANLEPTWVLSALDGLHVGPMNLTIRDCISGEIQWFVDLSIRQQHISWLMVHQMYTLGSYGT